MSGYSAKSSAEWFAEIVAIGNDPLGVGAYARKKAKKLVMLDSQVDKIVYRVR